MEKFATPSESKRNCNLQCVISYKEQHNVILLNVRGCVLKLFVSSITAPLYGFQPHSQSARPELGTHAMQWQWCHWECCCRSSSKTHATSTLAVSSSKATTHTTPTTRHSSLILHLNCSPPSIICHHLIFLLNRENLHCPCSPHSLVALIRFTSTC